MPLPLTVSCFSKIQICFTFLVPAHPGNPGQRAVKRVCVCVSVCVSECYSPSVTPSHAANDGVNTAHTTIYVVECGTQKHSLLLQNAPARSQTACRHSQLQRNSDCRRLAVPCFRLNTYGRRSFVSGLSNGPELCPGFYLEPNEQYTLFQGSTENLLVHAIPVHRVPFRGY